MISWDTIWAVAAGGALGALTRFGIGEGVRLCTPLAGWTAVLASNVVGTLLLAVLAAAAGAGAWFQASPADWALVATGYCGALTTYSAFGLDTVLLWYEGRRALALGQMASTLVVGLVAADAIARAWSAGG